MKPDQNWPTNICLWAVSKPILDHVDSGACKANGKGDFGQVDRSPTEPVFTIFDFPGAAGTFVAGLNDLGQAVGTYLDSSSKEHGFLLSNGIFTSIDFPGGVAGTEAMGINNLGQIVGDSFDASGNTHGYLLSMGNFSAIDFPGAFSLTQPEGINSHGRSSGFTTATTSSTASS